MTPQAIRQAAADLVRRGWCQGQFAMDRRGRFVTLGCDSATRHCMAAAIFLSAHRMPQLATAIAAAISAELGIDNLVDWQDAPERTQAEVIAALEGRREPAHE